MQILFVDPSRVVPSCARDLASELGWHVSSASDYRTAAQLAANVDFDVVMMSAPESTGSADGGEFRTLWRQLQSGTPAATLLAGPLNGFSDLDPGEFDRVPADAPMDELRGRFAMIERYHSKFARMQRDIHRLEHVGQQLNQHFQELDQEMRLAARLQKDFLPSVEQPIRNLQFAAIYRPATWVSGDIFDVFKIDEQHTGFYVADAVGHGVAASLLTMFIKRSVVSQQMDGDRCRVLSPSETMAALNETLVDQSLPHCQFVTACYGVINHETLELEFARGGHPYPIVVTADGDMTELKTSGALLGLVAGESFPSGRVQLSPGDKVVLYTDGVELAFQDSEGDDLDPTAYMDVFRSALRLPVPEMVNRLRHELDEGLGSLNPKDDITILGFEVVGKIEPRVSEENEPGKGTEVAAGTSPGS